MYNKYFLIVLLLISQNLFGITSDSLYTEIRNDTLLIHFFDEVNCMFSPIINYSISENIISIVAHDTSTEYVTCENIKAYSVPIIGLASGHYQINLYFKYTFHYYDPDSLYLINSTEIDYIKTGVQNYNTDDKITDIKMNFLYCYPNPFNSSLGIKFILPAPSKVQLIIFNNIGQCISKLDKITNFPASA